MAKYHIIIDNLESGNYKGENVVECDGFVILLDKGDSFGQLIHDVSRMDLATYIAQSDKLYPAAILARGLVDADKAEHNMKLKKQSGRDTGRDVK